MANPLFKPKERAFAWRRLKRVHQELPLVGDGFKERLDLTNVRRTKRLAGYDLKNKKVVYNRVVELETQLAKGTWYLLNKQLVVFQEQSIFANGRCVHVRELKLGDKLIGRLGKEVELTDIQKFRGTHTFYKMKISGDHSYYANGILLHNASRFWVGGTATWDNATTANWSATTGGASGASVPAAADTAIFDNLSGAITATTNYNPTITAITTDSTNLFPGTLKLGAALTLSGSLTIGSGTFQSQGNTINAAVTTCLAVTNTRALDITNSTVNITGAGTVWQTGTVTGLTLTATGSTIRFTANTASARTMGMGNGNTFNNVSVTNGTGTFATANATATIAGNLDFTGYTGNWLSGVGFNLMGNLILGASMTFTDGSSAVTMNGTVAQTITSNGTTGMRGITINTTSTVSLVDDLNINSLRTLTVSKGTFDANNKNITTGLFNSSNATARTINMGTALWTLSGVGTIWNMATTTNLTLNQGSATISVTDTSASSKTIGVGGSFTLPALSITGAGTGIVLLSGNITFASIAIGAPKTVTIVVSNTITVNGAFSAVGSLGNLITINSSTPGTPASLSKASGVVSCDFLSIQDSTATGGADWHAGPNSTNVSGNTGWVFGGLTQSLSDSVTASDATVKSVGKLATDAAVSSDIISRAIGKPFSDSVIDTDAIVKAFTKIQSDTVVVTDQESHSGSTGPAAVNLNDAAVTSDKIIIRLNGHVYWYTPNPQPFEIKNNNGWYTKNEVNYV